MEEFEDILKDLQEVMKKHGVEMRIKSELTFAKINGGNNTENTNSKTNEGGKSSDRKHPKR